MVSMPHFNNLIMAPAKIYDKLTVEIVGAPDFNNLITAVAKKYSKLSLEMIWRRLKSALISYRWINSESSS